MIFARNLRYNRRNIWLKTRRAGIVTSPIVWASWDYGQFLSCFIREVSAVSSIITRNMSVNIWNTCFHARCPITVSWNWRRKHGFPSEQFSSRRSRWEPVHVLVSSTLSPFGVCRNQRILIHKTFERIAVRGKSPMGWFFWFKLHLITNDKSEIVNFMFTHGNIDDREPLKQW